MTESRRRSLIWWNSAAMLASVGIFLASAICHQTPMHAALAILISVTSGFYLLLSPFALWAAIKSKYPPGILVAGYPMPIAAGAILFCIMLLLAGAAPAASVVAFSVRFLTGIWMVGGAVVVPICSAVVVFDLATRPKAIETKVLGCGGQKHSTLPPLEVAS